jgi:5-formyltetrahydrofolate cyclo-ligase
MNKSELRKIYLAKRKTLTSVERNEKSRAIAARFFQYFDLSRVTYLHSFLPIERFGEIDTKIILERVWREFPKVETLVPRVNFQTQEIESLKFAPQVELVESRFRIHEPAHDEMIDASRVDLVLVPLLCFDERGNRVGYGKGYYDKFLKTCRSDCLKIGLSYFPAIEKISDAHDQDVPLDFCVTPDAVVNF